MAFRTNKMPVLQEKSASGAVATFNTALAMPLASCNIAVNAWQEGSGDPSPDNVRPISGYSAIGVAHSNRNILPYTVEDIINANGGQSTWIDNQKTINGLTFTLNTDSNDKLTSITINGTTTYNTAFYLNSRFTSIYFPASTLYSGVSSNVAGYSARISYSGGQIISLTKAAVAKKKYSNCDIILFFNSGNTFELTVSPRLILSGESDNSYVPHEGVYKYIEIGSTVYGGEYDARTGVLTVTHGYKTINDLTGFDTLSSPNNHIFRAYASGLVGIEFPSQYSSAKAICSQFEAMAYAPISASDDGKFSIASQSIDRIVFIAHDYSTVSDFLTAFGTAQIVYLLATPTTIQLPPCPIDILQGENNIWADTGDVDLTYKDLDIAKRGNFREVFKLPS